MLKMIVQLKLQTSCHSSRLMEYNVGHVVTRPAGSEWCHSLREGRCQWPLRHRTNTLQVSNQQRLATTEMCFVGQLE